MRSGFPGRMNIHPWSSDNVFLPVSGQAAEAAHNRSETPPRVSIVPSSMARREVKSFVTKCLKLKTFELNNRMKLYNTPSGGRQETKLDSNNLVEFLNHLNIFYGHGRSLNKQNIQFLKPGLV